MSVHVVEVSGPPAERGRQHGEALRDEIAHCLAIYRVAIGHDEAFLRREAGRIGADLQRQAPELASEVEGIASGAGVEPWLLYVLNARSELMSSADGCTALFDPGSSLLGQTWDWIEHLEDLFTVLRIQRPDGHRMLTVTEPGMVAKIGLSSAGLGCTLNFLFSPGPHRGVPVHVMLRSVLEASDLSDAQRRIEGLSAGQSGNILIGAADGRGIDVELAGTWRRIESLGRGAFAHTNHHLWSEIPAGPLEANSRARLSRANALASDGATSSVAGMQAALSDTGDSAHPVCAPYKPMLGSKIGTVCTVVMELDSQRLHLRKGPDPAAPFEVITLAG